MCSSQLNFGNGFLILSPSHQMSNYHFYENGLIFNQSSLKEKNEKPVEILISNPKKLCSETMEFRV
jgi:hypothetical protein